MVHWQYEVNDWQQYEGDPNHYKEVFEEYLT
jgi:hypothetical protein